MTDEQPILELPTIPDCTDAAQLIEIIAKASAYYEAHYSALRSLFAMTGKERENFPDYLATVEAVRLELSAARQRQDAAMARLKRLAEYGDDTAKNSVRSTPPQATLG